MRIFLICLQQFDIFLHITVNNNQYQFIIMQMQSYPYKYNHSREITFSPLPNSNKTNNQSIQRRSKDRNRNTSPNNNNISHRNASPLHNLHYKYLPDNYISPERTKDSKQTAKRRYRQKENDNRTQGILKINSKIKNILQSIEQQEQRKELFVDKYANKDTSQFNQQNRNRSNTPKKHQNYTPKSTDKRQYINVCNRVQYKTPLKDKNLNEIQIKNISNNKYGSIFSLKRQAQQELSNYSTKQYPTSQIRQKQYRRYEPYQQKLSTSSASYNLMNSRYQNYSLSRIKKINDQAVIIKGKNVDNQIDKIQVKIEELQQLKKSMHIDFQQSKASLVRGHLNEGHSRQQSKKDSKKTEHSDVKRSIIDTFSKVSDNASKRQQSLTNEADSSSQMKSSLNIGGMVTSQIYNPRQKLSTQDVKIPKILRNLNSKRKKENSKKTNQIVNFNQIESSVSQFFNTNTQTPFSVQTSRQVPIASIANQINAAVTSLATAKTQVNQLKRLLNSLEQQIKADQQLSKAKKWFKNYKDENKWQRLQTILKSQGLWINRNKMKQIYTLNSQEQNPFYTPRQSDFTIKNLIEISQQSQNHWQTKLCNNFCKNKLNQHSFTQQNIDISRRGTISIEDIVRFINYQLETFHRNRDICLIYQRLKKDKVLYFQDILECFTKPFY